LLAFLAQWAFRLAKFSTKWFYLATLKKEMLLKKKRDGFIWHRHQSVNEKEKRNPPFPSWYR
jgi:hypothetical protein